ncbi:MAG TPA: aminotransferase, partial [Myxococcales bacterium]|nr:aminotransferase [Myxococcales bacterium]
MNPAGFHRAALLPPYVFAEMAELKARAAAVGRTVFDFSLGNPDGDPPPRVVEALEGALRSGAYRYPAANGTLELRQAMAR